MKNESLSAWVAAPRRVSFTYRFRRAAELYILYDRSDCSPLFRRAVWLFLPHTMYSRHFSRDLLGKRVEKKFRDGRRSIIFFRISAPAPLFKRAEDFLKNTQFFFSNLLTNTLIFSTIFSYTETYRSGHNGHDSKSWCPLRDVGSNPTVSAKIAVFTARKAAEETLRLNF